jgi:hypothetical protein
VLDYGYAGVAVQMGVNLHHWYPTTASDEMVQGREGARI